MSAKDGLPDVEVLSIKSVVFNGDEAGLEKFFKLEHWRVRVGGREDDRIIWKRGDFVLITAVTPENKIVLIREYKQAVGLLMSCLPAGACKKGEDPLSAALRELKEETGYTGRPTECAVSRAFYNSPDKSTERHFVVFIPNVVLRGAAKTDESETILGVELCSLDDALLKVEIGMHRMALEISRFRFSRFRF